MMVELFKNLKISRSKFFEKQGSAPVISISFRNYSEKNWENGFKTIKTAIADIYAEFKFLMDKLDKRELKKFENIWLEMDEGDWKNSLLMLTKYLYEYYGQKVIVLIDEYDHPIIDSYVKGYYDDAKPEFDAIESKLKHNVAKDLDYNRERIMQALASDIIGIYYYQRGTIEYTLKHDKQVKAAEKLLDDSKEYKELLAPRVVSKSVVSRNRK